MSALEIIGTEQFRDSPTARWRLKIILADGTARYEQDGDKPYYAKEDDDVDGTRVTRTTWSYEPQAQVMRRKYTLAEGNIFYQHRNEDEQGDSDERGDFFDEYGNQLTRQIAAEFRLDSQPRISEVTLLPTNRHTGQIASGSSNFPYTLSQSAGRARERASTREDAIADNEEQNELTDMATPGPSGEHNRVASKQSGGEPISVTSQCTVSIPQAYLEYPVRDGSYFKVGKVFLFLWIEIKGIGMRVPEVETEGKGKCKGRNNSGDASAQDVFVARLRPAIVVEKHSVHATCVPIFGHGGQGVGKRGLKGVEVEKYAVVHIKGKTPEFVPAEDYWVKKKKISLDDAFTVHAANKWAKLSRASRIRFDQARPVQFNCPVLDIGTVLHDQHERLQQRYRDANRANAAGQQTTPPASKFPLSR